jgi:nucleosome assembly protein 1-like 1
MISDTNRTRLVRKAYPTDSFFNFFSPPVLPADDDIDNGDLEEQELEEIEEKLEMDYQIGEDLKEKVSYGQLSKLMTHRLFQRSFPAR